MTGSHCDFSGPGPFRHEVKKNGHTKIWISVLRLASLPRGQNGIKNTHPADCFLKEDTLFNIWAMSHMGSFFKTNKKGPTI